MTAQLHLRVHWPAKVRAWSRRHHRHHIDGGDEMRWLRRDEGIVMVLVGLLLVVLLGMAGLAIDLGALYSERRQLRNGADAAALAIAEDCGRHPGSCNQGTANDTAQLYADANSDDGASGGADCGLTPTGPTTGRVEVMISALEGRPVRVPLMSLFGLDRVNVTAAATAIFDHPSSATGLARDRRHLRATRLTGTRRVRSPPCTSIRRIRAEPVVASAGSTRTPAVGAGRRSPRGPGTRRDRLRVQRAVPAESVYGRDVLIPLCGRGPKTTTSTWWQASRTST